MLKNMIWGKSQESTGKTLDYQIYVPMTPSLAISDSMVMAV